MKRFFSVLLALLLVVCLVPVQVQAYDCYYTVLAHKDGEYVSEINDWWGMAAPGTLITLQTPAQHVQLMSGYQISRVEVWESDSDAPAQTGVNSFVMPDGNVDVMVFYTPASGGTTPGGTSTQYNITRGTISNGNVLFSQDRAGANTIITITPEANAGYALNALTVTDSNKKSVTVTPKNGKFEFSMPASDVRVDAYFVPAIDVTFYYNDEANRVDTVPVSQGGSLAELPVPTRAGYLFQGWYTADNTQITTATVFNQSTIVYARWAKIAHTTVPGNNKFGADIGLSDEQILNMLVTDEERASGKDITVRLVVDPLSEGSVPTADKSAIEAMAGTNTLASYLDIRLLKKIGDTPEFAITNTQPNTIPITMTVDAGLIPANAGSVYIIYYHDGVAKTLNASYNAASRTLTFNASEFSTYALAYKIGGTGSGGNGGILDNVPKTGEASGLNGWITMSLCCTAMLVCVSIYDKKRAR